MMRVFLLLVAALFSIANSARADERTYAFQVTATSGPLAGTTAVGTFSFDESIVVPGALVAAVDLLSSLTFTWNGITYTAATANTGSMVFDSEGNLTHALFGTNCVPGSCQVSGIPSSDQWTAFVDISTSEPFSYSLPGINGIFDGTTTLMPPPIDQVSDIRDAITALGDVELKNSLDSKLRAVLQALENGRTETACALLEAFINQVDAQNGQQLSHEQAGELTEAALTLAVVLGCSVE